MLTITELPGLVRDQYGNIATLRRWGTRDKAIAALETLTDCAECTDCRHLSRCRLCTDCTFCTDCIQCISCHGCIAATDCRKCTNCVGCADCENAVTCTDCRDCGDITRSARLSHCWHCEDSVDLSYSETTVRSRAGKRLRGCTRIDGGERIEGKTGMLEQPDIPLIADYRACLGAHAGTFTEQMLALSGNAGQALASYWGHDHAASLLLWRAEPGAYRARPDIQPGA